MLERNESFYRNVLLSTITLEYSRFYLILHSLSTSIPNVQKYALKIFDKPILVFFIQWTTYEAGITNNILNT